MRGIVLEDKAMRRLEELKSSILLTERSPIEESDEFQNDVELLTIEERQELLQHMRKPITEARHLVVCTLSANVLDNGWYVNIHCQTHLPKGYYPTNDRFDGAFRYVRVTVTPKDNRKVKIFAPLGYYAVDPEKIREEKPNDK
jgi:hypothetical protein